MSTWKEFCENNKWTCVTPCNEYVEYRLSEEDFDKIRAIIKANQNIRKHGAHLGLLTELFKAMDELGVTDAD